MTPREGLEPGEVATREGSRVPPSGSAPVAIMT